MKFCLCVVADLILAFAPPFVLVWCYLTSLRFSSSLISFIHEVTIVDYFLSPSKFNTIYFFVASLKLSMEFYTGTKIVDISFWRIETCFNLSFTLSIIALVKFNSVLSAFYSSSFLTIFKLAFLSNCTIKLSWSKNV